MKKNLIATLFFALLIAQSSLNVFADGNMTIPDGCPPPVCVNGVCEQPVCSNAVRPPAPIFELTDVTALLGRLLTLPRVF